MMDRPYKILSVHTLGVVTPFAFLLLYLVFPSGLSTTDGWNYAAEIKYSGEFFHPYHLLYNTLGYLFCYLPVKAGADTLGCLKVMNSLFATALLYVVRLILYRLNRKDLLVVLICCLSGSSFAIMRFATENETYIIPLFLALLASYFFLRFLQQGYLKDVFFTGIFLSLAVMFHITYIVWWLCILVSIIRKSNRRPLFLYLLTSLSIPATYLVILLYLYGNLTIESVTGFIFNDFISNSHFELTGKSIFFSFANLIRSFIQVHGYLLHIIKQNFLFIIPGIILMLSFIVALFRLPSKDTEYKDAGFSRILIMVVSLQFLLAAFSSGNAEFMVMIPVLTFILLSVRFAETGKFLFPVLTGILIWNLSYGIIPLHFISKEPEQFLCDLALREESSKIIASDDQILKSIIYYEKGIKNVENIYKSPAVLQEKGMAIGDLRSLIDTAVEKGEDVYTDCLNPQIMSRASILEGDLNRIFFSKYITIEIRTWNTITGTKSVEKIESSAKK
jgi:hypothetical protein